MSDELLPQRPTTGDRGVDGILAELGESLAGDPEGHVDAVARAHRLLQARLSGPRQPDPPRPG